MSDLLPARIPDPPADYNREHMAQIIDVLRIVINRIRATGPLMGSALNLITLQDNGSGLRNGDVYIDGGFLRITGASTGYPSPLLAESALGTVTVVTP